MSITKAASADAGCWIDGHWGQYGVARLVEIAAGLGYGSDGLAGTAEVVELASRHMSECTYPGTDAGLTDDDHERLSDASDEVEDWLNFNVAPAGYSFGWHDGEFFLQSAEWWEVDAY
jgi:hypothetical protein